MRQSAFVIAIDGPVASGKGTIAQLLAQKLHGFHLNTGAMYRALTLYCLKNHVDISDEEKVIEALKNISFALENTVIYINNEDVTKVIKESEVTEAVPVVAAIAKVREEMVKRQREIGLEKIAEGKIVIVDARDGATKIFPDAPLKIFLTASPEVRAKRRLMQLGELDYEKMLDDVKKRDYQDTHRQATPLVSDPVASGYTLIDDSNLTKDDTIALILQKLPQ